jgi:catechol 2,3-dioxygenase-like lactoylglutathione lyase family enzyme
MLDHVSLGVTNLERSREFYDTVLCPLGIVRTVDFGNGRGSDYGAMGGQLGVEFTIALEPGAAPSRGMHLCICASVRPIERCAGLSCRRARHRRPGGWSARIASPLSPRLLRCLRS